LHKIDEVPWKINKRANNEFITYEEKSIWSESEEGGKEEVNDCDDAEVVVVAFSEGSSVSLGVVTCR
jgi:hypothetical protein